jgi:putative ABC transport system permease protein
VHDIEEQSVTPEYFHLIGVPFEKGRAFEWPDREGSLPVAIINDAVARKYFPDENPVGKQIRFYGALDQNNPWLTIVGVVATEKRSTPYQEMTWANSLIVYHPLDQKAPFNDVSVLLRTRAEAAVIQRQVAQVDPAVVAGNIQTMELLVSRYVAYPRFRAVLLGVFAAMALLLAAVGLYGVLSQLVAQRTQEIGVRMALGARGRDVLALVLKDGMLLAGAGVLLGLLAASWLTRFLASLLFGVPGRDPVTLSAVSLVLLAAAFLATYLPARRASSIEPIVALRHE